MNDEEIEVVLAAALVERDSAGGALKSAQDRNDAAHLALGRALALLDAAREGRS